MNPVQEPWRQVRRKPLGGFVLIPVGRLLSAWEALRDEVVTLRDVRVLLACEELVARRCGARRNVPRRYTLDELQRLVGGENGAPLRVCLARLSRAGLLEWSESAITLKRPELPAKWSAITNPARRVPFPRRMVRVLAREGTKALIATVVGSLLRGVFYRQGQCVSGGRVKASDLAAWFGVDTRSVERCRRRLVGLCWLVAVPSHQSALNRSGMRFLVNLDWSGDTARTPRPQRAPVRPDDTPVQPVADAVRVSGPHRARAVRLSGPRPVRNPLRALVHQKPARRGTAGVCGRATTPPRSATAPPTLRHITPADLDQLPRLLALHEEAAARGLASASEAGRLAFVALAERARRRATRNPAGCFRTLLDRQAWHFITHADEDRARRRIAGAERHAASGPIRSRAQRSSTASRDWARAGTMVPRLLAGLMQPGEQRDRS